ncbi:carbohydrate-binding domain-containing protein [Candidatus Saccharibacteria bacterium]|nr:carbohydrate-binding domain-containing protein [Candidatus Saccharibacteria bacterium]MBQ9029812.1 carbohydrate-binding domain-containing protein [Candidatus Saccharibacteria bacterium]
MDKELDNIADNIIKDSLGSAAPSATPANGGPASHSVSAAAAGSSTPNRPAVSNQPAMAESPVSESLSAQRRPATGDPFSQQPTPRDTFTVDVPQPRQLNRTQAMPTMNGSSRNKSNEYNRIKEQMSAAREASNIPTSFDQVVNQPERGLNKIVLLFIILIPVIVVAIGVIVALLLQPSSSNNSSSSNQQVQYTDPRTTATKIDLATYTEEIQITDAGHYVLSGVTTFPIKVNAAGEVTLYLHDISVTATDASAISNFSHNPLVIVLDDGTESTLAVTDPNTFDSIYSEGDLTIDGGTGVLNVSGIKIADGYHYDVTGNGIKDSKDVVITPANPENSSATPAEGESGFQQGTPSTENDGPTTGPTPAEN